MARRRGRRRRRLSILYLRCVHFDARVVINLAVNTFNSLFEMLCWARGICSPVEHITFNSLFEMRGRGRGGRGHSRNPLSILYLRCDVYDAKAQALESRGHAFNSLFEMRQRQLLREERAYIHHLSILYLRCGNLLMRIGYYYGTLLSILYLRCAGETQGRV